MFPVGSKTHRAELNEEVIKSSSAHEKASMQNFFKPNLEFTSIYRSNFVATTAKIAVITCCIYTYIVDNESLARTAVLKYQQMCIVAMITHVYVLNLGPCSVVNQLISCYAVLHAFKNFIIIS